MRFDNMHSRTLGAIKTTLRDCLQKLFPQPSLRDLRVVIREQDIITKKEAEMFEFERILEQNKITLEQKEKELLSQKAEKSQLLEENAKATKYKIMLENLDKEKKQLEKKVSTLEIITSQTKINANSSDPSHLKLIEEQELAQSQIDFLNSVIVEMQKKNETLKARVEILEMGVLPSDVDELNLNGITPKTLPPRLYCDICEMFDLHDTEDCPRQAMDSPPPASPKLKTKAKERPYCESCEVFGHDTADCDDGETF